MTRIENIRKNIYHTYDEEYLKNILIRFREQILDISNFNIENRNISKVLDHFFEDLIFQAKSRNGTYSPKEIIDRDELLQMALFYIDEHKDFYHAKSDEANLRNYFFNSSKVGKVTNFNPVIARKIYERYIPKTGGTIFDYSCGYGSRMLGALSSKYEYHYIGVDPYKELYFRLLTFSNWIFETLETNAQCSIFNSGSEIFIPSLKNQIDLSFSSPPFFNYEKYTNCVTQSYIRYKTYKEWLKHFVIPTLTNIYNYTKSGGLHLINLENNRRIKIIEDWINIATDIGFNLEEITNIPTLKRSSSKHENKLIIMKK